MPRIDDSLQITHSVSRRYLRSLRDGPNRAPVYRKVRTHLRQANRTRTPRRTGRLRRSFRVRPQDLFNYNISWAAYYASWVNQRGRSRGFVGRVKATATRSLRDEARRWRDR